LHVYGLSDVVGVVRRRRRDDLPRQRPLDVVQPDTTDDSRYNQDRRSRLGLAMLQGGRPVTGLERKMVLNRHTHDGDDVDHAQLALTLDHYSEGRFFLALGAGENKQSTPYGLMRDKPFGRLEETLKLMKLWFNTNEPINYDGKFYTIRNGGISTPAFTEGGPQLLVAGGPGKAMQFGAQLADGWVSYFPGSSPEDYVGEVQEFNRLAREAGKDPDEMTRLMLFAVVLGDTEEQVEEALRNPIVRWDAAALVPGGHTWKKHGLINPLGEDFAYVRDLYPMEWSREDAMKIVDQITPDMVRHFKFSGTPEQGGNMIQPFIEAGANHVMLGDYGSLVTAGDMGSAVEGSRRLAECFDHLRRLNGQPTKLPQLATTGDG
jgi:phthiodiolone/phenolphthiodiolone dimycocerosates ketoreductase